MSSILTPSSYRATFDKDIVSLQIDSRTITLWYQDGFKLAQDTRVACKQAMPYDQLAAKHWRTLARLNDDQHEDARINPSYRRSGERPNLVQWETAYEGPIVIITFIGLSGSNFAAKMHFSDALKLHRAIRIASRSAKAWAGDRSRTRRTIGTLTDAEDNDKLIVC